MSLYWSAPYLLKFCNFCLFNPELKNTLKFFYLNFFFAIFFHFDFEPLVHLLCGVLLQILSYSNHSLFYVIISQKRWLCPAPRKQDRKTGQPDLIIISSHYSLIFVLWAYLLWLSKILHVQRVVYDVAYIFI